MKVILLAGGFGTRLSEYTEIVPKPMVKIGNKPILKHIMEIFVNFGHKDFNIALGYKSEVIKNYFLNKKELPKDKVITINHKIGDDNCRVTLVDTGQNSMTGGRVKRMQQVIGKETCLLTYGDGLADIDINKLLKFHQKHGKLATVSAVRPAARFGVIKMDGDKVVDFHEKPQMQEGWINGGFFVIEPGFFDFIKDDKTILERDPLELASKKGELYAYKHYGFWHCMDTKRDKDNLEQLYIGEKAPWIKKIK